MPARLQARFIQSGTYLLLEKLQMAAFRRLFKKCFLVHEQVGAPPCPAPHDACMHAFSVEGCMHANVAKSFHYKCTHACVAIINAIVLTIQTR